MAEINASLRAALGDHYTIERELGRGGMATVYLARDLKHARLVALKVLRPELAAALGPERFEREIKLAARLRHSHILTVHDSGNAAGQLWFTMPYVEGESLRERLTREQQLPVDGAVQIALEVADALAYAHHHDVVHRDIKPENILLDGGHAVVADFGIARAIRSADEQRLTETGLALGTPAYMSPEQATGSRVVDGRTDVYSLGCVLYEMLAGDPPFTGTTAQAVIARQLLDPPPPLRTVRPTVTQQLEQVVQKALAKIPADRFGSASEFAEALRTGSIATAVPHKRPSGLVVVLKRFRAQTITAILVLISLIGAVWAMRHRWPGASGSNTGSPEAVLDPRHIAVMYFEDVSAHHDLQYLADGLTEALIFDMRAVQPLQVRSRYAVAPYKGARVPADSIARALRVGTLVRGEVAREADRVRVRVTLINGATGADLGRDELEHSTRDVFGLRNDLNLDVALLLSRGLGLDVQSLEIRTETRNPAAWELVQRAEVYKESVESLVPAGDTAQAKRALALADSQLARASAMDTKWALPVVNRGWVAFEQRKVMGFGKAPASNWTARGLAFAEQGLKIQPGDPEAFRLRGTQRYVRYLLSLNTSPLTPEQLLDSAEADLRAAAVPSNPDQASAWSLLSHLLARKSDASGAKLAALWAYQADPYLPDVNELIYRGFSTLVDMADAAQAAEMCQDGYRRFPKDPYFTECQFEVMAIPGQHVDVVAAWRALEQDVELYQPSDTAFRRRRNQLLVSFALLNAGLKDSADRVALRSRADSTVDPNRELIYFEAALRNRMGDRDESLRLLQQYFTANPQDRMTLANDQSWWWRGVHDDPRFKVLVGAGSRH